MKKLTEEQFEELYPCIINHNERENADPSTNDEDICGFGGKMYETFGADLEFVTEMAKQNRVLTIIESDEDETNDDLETVSVWYVTSGMHHVNRIGYLVTEKPINGEDFEVRLEY